LVDVDIAAATPIDGGKLAIALLENATKRTNAIVDRGKWCHVAPQNPRLQHVTRFRVGRRALKSGGDDHDGLTVKQTGTVVQDKTEGAMRARTASE
jgi:hypothetical protein